MEARETGSSVVKLHYFPIHGAGQPIRNLLYFLDVPFEDVAHELTRGNETEVGFNLGFPMLEDREIKIHETIAIMIYLCRKHERPQLLGLTPQSIARTQEVLMKFYTQRKRIMNHIFQTLSNLAQEQEKGNYVQGQLKKMANDCRFIDYCLKVLAKGKEYIQESITLVDFLFYEQCFYLAGFFAPHINKTSPFKLIIEFKDRFEKLPFFERNKARIEEKCLFHQFKNEELNKMIRQNWNGGKCGSLLKQHIQE